MKTQSVYILATVRNPALLEAALLVFKTVRVGFPTAHVLVRGNGLEIFAHQELARAAQRVGAAYANAVVSSHDQWIESMVLNSVEPFWICDTDIVFFEPVEHWFAATPMTIAGRLEPEFCEEWTNSCHVERLHTCLMYIDPAAVRLAMRTWMGQQPAFFHQAQMALIRQQFIPVNGQEPLFYDTCAGLYQAGIGHPFTAEQNHAFEHLHCATYSDLVAAPGLKDLAAVHKQVFANPAIARGMQRDQAIYYSQRTRPRGAQLVVTEKEAHAIQPRSNINKRRVPRPRN